MARHIPKSATVVALTDFEPYVSQLQGVTVEPPNPQFPDYGPSLKFVLQVSENPDDTIWIYSPIRLGKNSAGVYSKLRRMLNAFANKPEGEAIEWFDDETFEFGYAGGEIHKLHAGDPIVIRGRNTQGDDGTARFRVEHFASATPLTAKPAPVRATAAASSAPPF